VKVLHLIQRYRPAVGGSETWCREICQHLAQTAEMKILTFDVFNEEEYWADPPVEQCTLRLGRLDWDGRVLVRRYQRSLPIHTVYHSLLKVVLDRWLRIYFYGPHSVEMYGRVFAEAQTADVVHLHTVPYPHNLVGYLAARVRGKRVVITPHFHPGHPHYERWSNYSLLKHCDSVITVSEYERDYLTGKGIDPKKIVVTGNGVNVEAYRPTDVARLKAKLWRAHNLSAHTRAIVFLGRKVEYKGVATLVEAFKRLPPDRDAVLFLAGPSSAWFDEFYASLPVADHARIIDLGVLPEADKVDLLHLADVLVLPSRFEAFGIVLLEAWACQTPVIVADTGAMPGIVGDAGFTFKFGNAADLAEKLDRLFNDPAQASRTAASGHAMVLERYTWAKLAERTKQAYHPAQVKPRRLRVLIASSLFPPHVCGGAEIVAHKEAVILKDLGVDVHVFCGRVDPQADDSYPAVAEEGEIRKTRVSLRPADFCGDRWNFRNDKVRQRFARVLDDFAPDVVHFHNLVGLSVTVIDECETRAIPTVLTLHDYWGLCFKNTLLKNDGAVCDQSGADCLDCRTALIAESSVPSRVRNAHVLLSLRKVDQLISPSQYLADRYAANGIPRGSIRVIHNGIDFAPFAGPPSKRETFTLGFIGYLGKHKGLHVLLRALTLVAEPGIRLFVAGSGEERENLETLCRELGLDRLVTFLGRIDNAAIAALYAKIDALVLPSVWPENSPVTITEAMASGIPVIASDIGGIGELVQEGVTGLLVPAQDAQALADGIGRLRGDPNLRAAMGRNARAQVQDVGARRQVARLHERFVDLSTRTRSKRSFGPDIVVYSSKLYWHRAIRDMLDQIAGVEKDLQRRLLVCRIDLCDEDTIQAARLLLLPTSGADCLLHGLQALKGSIPLLASADADEPRDLCQRSSAGLVYADPAELRECLKLLLTDDHLRRAMGKRGQAFIHEQARQIRAEGR